MASLVTTTVTGTITVSSDGSFGGANETSATLFVRGGNADFWNSTNSLLRINHDGTRANLQCFTGGAYDKIALNPDGGSVGIGIASPLQKLHVSAGKIAVTDGYNIGSIDGETGMYVDTDTDIRFQVDGTLIAKIVKTAAVNHLSINSGSVVEGSNSHADIQVAEDGGIAMGSAYTFANIYGDGGNLHLRANSYPANLGAESIIYLQTSTSAGGQALDVVVKGGNVGIGTVSPPHKLSIYGTGAGEATVQIEGEGGADPYINFLVNNTTHWAVGADDSASDSFKISQHSALGTNDFLVVRTDGKVGIGTNNPSTEGLEIMKPSADTTFNLNDQSDSMLVLRNSDSASTNTGRFCAIQMKINSNSAAAEGTIRTQFAGDGDADLIFSTTKGGTGYDRMFLDEDGFVGIGTNGPETRLHVEGSTYSESSIKMERSGSGINEDAGLIFSKSSAATDGHRLGGIYFGHSGTNYALIRAEMDASTGGEVYIVAADQTNAISNTSTKTLQITAGETTINGTFKPRVDSAYTLGTTANRWSHLYIDEMTAADLTINTVGVYITGGTDIDPSSGGAGQFRVTGNGYTSFLAMNGTAAYFGHNSSGRSLVLMTNETARLTITGGGAATFSSSVAASSFSGNGASLTSLNGSNISSGTVAAARLGSGSSITSKFLRGDNTWQTVSGGSGTVTSVATSGAITGGTITTSGTISHSTANGYKHIPSNGANGQFLRYSSAGTAAWASGLLDYNNFVHYVHRTSNGSTNGGSLTGQQRNVRTLNAVVTNNNASNGGTKWGHMGGASVGESPYNSATYNNQIILDTGTYFCMIWGIGIDTDEQQIMLVNTTGTKFLVNGMNSDSSGYSNAYPIMAQGTFTLSADNQVCQIEHWVNTTPSSSSVGTEAQGRGLFHGTTPDGAGGTDNDPDFYNYQYDMYTSIMIWKVG